MPWTTVGGFPSHLDLEAMLGRPQDQKEGDEEIRFHRPGSISGHIRPLLILAG